MCTIMAPRGSVAPITIATVCASHWELAACRSIQRRARRVPAQQPLLHRPLGELTPAVQPAEVVAVAQALWAALARLVRECALVATLLKRAVGVSKALRMSPR
ncbi:MAG: hypothetical protein FJ116_07090 [Deltaproteobacteria bacterium]|nr:hypothetical protein [Deltaproteobacteria bacterium]